MFQRRSHSIIPRKQFSKIHFVNAISWPITVIIFILIIPSDDLIQIGGMAIIIFLVAIPTGLKYKELEKNWHFLATNFDLKISTEHEGLVIRGLFKDHWITITARMKRFGRGFIKNYLQINITLKHMVDADLIINQYSFYDRLTSKKSKDDLSRYLTYSSSPEDFFSQIIASRYFLNGLLDLGDAAKWMNIKLGGQSLSYEETGEVADIVYIKAVLDLLVEIAQQVERLEAHKLDS